MHWRTRYALRANEIDPNWLRERGAKKSDIGPVDEHYNSYVFHLDSRNPQAAEIETRVHSTVKFWFRSIIWTEAELEDASIWLIYPTRQSGYPQPDDDFGYLDETCHPERCGKCGAGQEQRAPFRMKGEVKWARSSFFCLHWTTGAIFLDKAVWESVFRPIGIEAWPVLSKGGKELQSVVQLRPQGRLTVKPESSHLEVCKVCGFHKRNILFDAEYQVEGKLGAGCLYDSTNLMGSGLAAMRYMLATSQFRNAYLKADLNGLRFLVARLEGEPRTSGPLPEYLQDNA